MKKKNSVKNEKTVQVEKNKKEQENVMIQSKGLYHDFLIMEKKELIKDSTLQFKIIESEY